MNGGMVDSADSASLSTVHNELIQVEVIANENISFLDKANKISKLIYNLPPHKQKEITTKFLKLTTN